MGHWSPEPAFYKTPWNSAGTVGLWNSYRSGSFAMAFHLFLQQMWMTMWRRSFVVSLTDAGAHKTPSSITNDANGIGYLCHFFQEMPCHPFSTETSPGPRLVYCHLDTLELDNLFFYKMDLNMSSVNLRPFCSGLDTLKYRLAEEYSVILWKIHDFLVSDK